MPPLRTGLEGGSHGCAKGLGAPVRIHWTFWFNFIFQVIYAIIYYSSSWKYITLIAILWGPACLLFVYIHELGHLWANRRYGGHCSQAVLWPLGGFSDCYIERCTCMQEFFVALCGPLTHILQFAIWVVVMAVSSEYGADYYGLGFNFNKFNTGGADDWFAEFAKRALNINMTICFLNLFLPIYPLDAARMLAALLCQCGLKVDKVCLMMIIVGGLLGLGFTIYAIIALVDGASDGLMYLFVGLFVLFTTFSLLNYYRVRRVTSHPLFSADCYTDRRTYASGSAGGPTRTYTTGRANATDSRKRRSDIETGGKKSGTARKSSVKSTKKLTYQEALAKARKMKIGQLKRECQQRGIRTTNFKEKSQYEVAYAKSF